MRQLRQLQLLRQLKAVIILAAALLGSGLACSSVDDVIGQRPAKPSPTAPAFVTATPGGRISVLLVTQSAVQNSGKPTATPLGAVIGPAATATAIASARNAATAAANVTPVLPAYVSGECPPASAPPPPPKPATFNQYPEVIGRYLSSGGPATLLEGILRQWGAIKDGAVVQSDTDLTGDGVPEIIVTLYDPTYYQPAKPAAGEMLIYGCAQRGYRLLFSTNYTPVTMIPELRRVGDMNGSLRASVAYTQKTCDQGRCSEEMQIMNWNAGLGVFRPLNDTPIVTTNAKVAVADLDGDGVLEIAVNFNFVQDMTAGPQRRTTAIWDWDGAQYRMAVLRVDPPAYRIHVVHDADQLFAQNDWKGAIKVYDLARNDQTLQGWSIPNEPVILRAYASLKRIVALAADDRRRTATNSLQEMIAENPAGSPGDGYVVIAQAFVDNVNKTADLKKACKAALNAAATRPDALLPLNSYGYANRAYSASDLCPFQ